MGKVVPKFKKKSKDILMQSFGKEESIKALSALAVVARKLLLNSIFFYCYFAKIVLGG